MPRNPHPMPPNWNGMTPNDKRKPWEKVTQPWTKVPLPWKLSSTASISGGAGDGIKEMLRKKFYVVRKKNHVVRKIFYVASISVGAAGRKNRPRWRKTSRRCGHFCPPPTNFLPWHSCVYRIPIFFYKNGRSGWSFPLRPFPCAKGPSIRRLLSACLQRERLAQVASRVAYGQGDGAGLRAAAHHHHQLSAKQVHVRLGEHFR